eukprot:PITA_17858
MRYWEECYNPNKEKFLAALVWVRLFGLPLDFWDSEILEGIGNRIGSFVKIAEATKKGRYTSYARICVYMNIANPIPNTVELEYHKEVWQQTLDYEHIPFRCRICHEYGHLFKEFPLTMEEEERKNKKVQKPHRGKANSFEILQEEAEDEDQTMEYQEDKEKDTSSSSERTHTKRKELSDIPGKGKEREEQIENMEIEMEINMGEDISIEEEVLRKLLKSMEKLGRAIYPRG